MTIYIGWLHLVHPIRLIDALNYFIKKIRKKMESKELHYFQHK